MKNHIRFYNKQLVLERILFQHEFSEEAPTVVFFAGIHGNEPAGVYALHQIRSHIVKTSISLKGNIYGIAGNLKALKKNIRYLDEDLNRLWTQETFCNLSNSANRSSERQELQELYAIIKSIIAKNKGPIYFIDLHTTSAKTLPFITISDSLENRSFAAKFQVPIILGIEEFLEGPLLTFINEFGYTSLGYEAGQHADPKSVENCKDFIWRSLIFAGCAEENQLKAIVKSPARANKTPVKGFLEIRYRYTLDDGEDFMMLGEFDNFEVVKKNQLIALSGSDEIHANQSGLLFMPLYQLQGKEGFFIIKEISHFWIWLSSIVRILKLHALLSMLPGVKQDPNAKHSLIVNPKTAAFLAVEIFHLFGYRKKISRNNKLYFIRRDREVSRLY